MKSGFLAITLIVSALSAGCSRSDEDLVANGTNSNSVSGQEVKARYKDAAAATKTYLAENKDEFVATMERKLRQLDDKITTLGKKSEVYKDEAKVQADQSLETVRDQRKTVAQQFDKLKASSAEAWKEVKVGFNSAMDELEKAYENAKAKLN